VKLKNKTNVVLSERINIFNLIVVLIVKKSSPEVGLRSVEMILNSVDFPLPLSPVMAINSPF
jgi:hypothetical protein